MAAELTWLGHGTWSIAIGKHTVLLDPYLDENPAASCKSDAVAADYILLTHGHFDHIGDVAKIAKRTGAMLIANHEICNWFAKQGIANAQPLNLGGGINMPFGHVKMTIAEHSSAFPDGTYAGRAGGFLLTLGGAKVYFAGDTGIFEDMRRIGAAGIDLAVLPIGDVFTMGPDDALEAVKLLKPKHVVPCHYSTWPLITQDPQRWADRVNSETTAIPRVLKPGERISV